MIVKTEATFGAPGSGKQKRWRFKVRDAENDMIDFDSEFKYLSDVQAREAGLDAIDFNLHCEMYTLHERKKGEKL